MSLNLPIQLLPTYPWRFFRAGGFDQVRLDTGKDLSQLDKLDQKFWVALACPTQGLEFDSKTLELIDADKDGRIRAPDVIAAVKWAMSLLKDPDELVRSATQMPLAAINDATPEGKRLLDTAKHVLSTLGKADATALSVDDTTDTQRIFSLTRLNGDGVVTPDATEDPVVRLALEQIVATQGGIDDRSKNAGVDRARVEKFFAELTAYLSWHDRPGVGDTVLLPLGEQTKAASAALTAVRSKIEDFFARCRMAAFDARSTDALNREEKDYLTIAAKDLTISSAEVAGFPLAMIQPGASLPLATTVNPAWAARIDTLRKLVIAPLIGDSEHLTEAQWTLVTERFAAFDAWQATKAGASVEPLGIERIRALQASSPRDAIIALIDTDLSLAPQFEAIATLDKLVRFHRDLYKLLLNFVNFREFYGGKEKAIFQVGTLYLDQRACELCIRVEDMARHALMVPLSQTYLAYLECNRKSTSEKMTIVAAFTNGDSDNLMVGRNGLFYDRKGRDWDATIIKIVDNPISIRQAFWSPYKRLIRWVGEQIAKRAAAADALASSKLEAAVTHAATAATTAPPPPPAAAPAAAAPVPAKGLDAGLIAAFSVAFGFVATAFAGIMSWLASTPAWTIPLYILLLLLLISGPSMVIAWLKLQQRNIAPILDANGWAVNAKARVNISFGKALTSVATLPLTAERDLLDPYADKKVSRIKIGLGILGVLALYLVWYFGVIHSVAPGLLPSSEWVKAHEAAAKGK